MRFIDHLPMFFSAAKRRTEFKIDCWAHSARRESFLNAIVLIKKTNNVRGEVRL